MYQKQESRIIKHIDFFGLDIIILELSFCLAYLLRHGVGKFMMDRYYLAMAGVLMLLWAFVGIFFEFYQDILRRGYLIELKKVIIQVSIVMVCVFTFMFLTKTQNLFSRSVFLMLWGICMICIYAERLIWKRIVRRKLLESGERSRILVVSEEDVMESCIKKLRSQIYQPYVISGAVVYNQSMKGKTIAGVPIVANGENLFSYVQHEVVDEVYLYIPSDNQAYKQLVDDFLKMGVTVHISLEMEDMELPNQIFQSLGDSCVITTSIKTASRYQVFMKRMMDIAGGIIGLMITGVLFVILAPIIYHQSPGPIFFSQERVGRNGRRFRIYKFRSMYLDAEERKKELMEQNKMSGLMFKMDDDPRIFPAGKFIRKYSLDEFPQFWNVLKGDMSLVGTRPPTVDEYEQYEAHHKVRLAIKPGLTGMWQVSGRSDITDFEEVVKLDNQYIAQWGLRLDMKILWKTVLVVLGSRGSV